MQEKQHIHGASGLKNVVGRPIMPPRFAKRTDANQAEIVAQLRSIPGVTVEVHHSDILVGRMVDGTPRTFWFELKNPNAVSKKSKAVQESKIKDSQKKIRSKYTGHYSIVWSVEQIMAEIGITK